MSESKSVTVRKTIDNRNKKEGVPAGAKIVEQTETIETEKIENGFIICKRIHGSYELKGDRNWFEVCKKWYSKTDPVNVEISDKSLADEF